MPKQVEFLTYNLPNLKTGGYTIEIEQSIYTEDGITIPQNTATTKFINRQKVFITGQRFELDGGQVRAVFPPEGNYGDYANKLPHVTLNRPTLPWERDVRSDDSTTPWLALLVLEEGEILKEKQLTINDLTMLGTTDPSVDFPPINTEACENGSDNVNVIDIKKETVDLIIPSVDELRYLAHVRRSDTEDAFATIIANRLPKPGVRNIVHLVSLDDRYDSSGDFIYNVASNPDDVVRFVSLHKWNFTIHVPDDTFARILNRIGEGTNVLKKPTKTTDPVLLQNILNEGSTVIPQFFRNGSASISYYRGPFAPGFNSELFNMLPAMNQDELMIFNSSRQMFDPSYSCAWMLGRMLTLQSRRVSSALYRWKRERACQITMANQMGNMGHLPQYQRTMNPTPVPEVVLNWFDDLSELKGVPFVYLVPDEFMLPTESVRFFQVDTNWMACLLDGALSIGRNSQQDTTNDRVLISEVLGRDALSPKKPCFDAILLRYQSTSTNLPTSTCMSGVLLRSAVVAGWPDLLVDGFDEIVNDTNFVPSQTAQNLVRMDHLSKDTLLCLFEGEVNTVDFYLKVEALNFGVNDPNNLDDNCPDEDTTALTLEQIADCKTHKRLRNPDGSESEQVVIVPFKNSDQTNQRVIDFIALVNDINATGTTPAVQSSAQLALHMIEGAEKVRFHHTI